MNKIREQGLVYRNSVGKIRRLSGRDKDRRAETRTAGPSLGPPLTTTTTSSPSSSSSTISPSPSSDFD
ncbi:hypothetical protein Hanom_Chr02g00133351 [Helianthus anomalus]